MGRISVGFLSIASAPTQVETTCATCGKVFKSKANYKVHNKMHLRAQGVSEEEANTKLYYFCDR